MSKRKFLKISIRFMAGIALYISPLFSWVRIVHAKIQKTILPKNFPRKDLIDKNPANLDTRNLN
ncbi:MAG: hypothetical protein WBY47_18055, partial [Desulfobacterales bacterium]